MGQLWKILRRAGVVVGPCLTVGTLVFDALDIAKFGLPVGIWVAIGLSIFFISIIAIVFGQHRDIEGLKNQVEQSGHVPQLSPEERYRKEEILSQLTKILGEGKILLWKEIDTNEEYDDWRGRVADWHKGGITYIRDNVSEIDAIDFGTVEVREKMSFANKYNEKHNNQLNHNYKRLEVLRGIIDRIQGENL